MPTKPTILFVPGAWHVPESYDLVAEQLQAAGYPTIYVSLPSVSLTPIDTFEPDVDAIRAKLEPLVEAGSDVVVVAHSYGSMPTNEAIKGLTRADRAAAGQKGGVAHYVFCSAFITPVGVSLMDALQGKDLPWFIVSPDKKVVHPDNPRDIFYADLDDATATRWVERLLPFSYQTYFSKTRYAAYVDVPSTFIFCTEDKAIPPPVQEMMVAGAEQQGAKFGRTTIGASHSPMISQPGEVFEAIRKAANSITI
ncbi:hypothetical protein SLS60_001028 [Paraconiothyrium brasiliense]|uniref:AB hydrolase-1 domain-containing protein n=1 Tax=Paraconiothyrium brasiliense TaxID=300254 RepID=A0ABR3S7X8_9PLEO